MNYIVKIEGQEIPLPEEVAKTDDGVKRALVPFYPDAANALITRVENEGVTTITVVKKAGTKGLLPLIALDACPGGRNPAIELAEEIKRAGNLSVLELLEMDERIDQAIEDGETQTEQMKAALNRLDAAAAQSSPWTAEGF